MSWFNRHKDLTAVAIIILVILIRFFPFVLHGTQILSDSWKSYYPWRAQYSPDEIKTINYDSNLEYASWFPMVRDEVWHGRFPNWNDKSFCGTPLYANHLIPIFHLPFAIALFWPGEMVFTAYSLMMALFGTLFFYWFLRNWRLGVYVSFFGAMVFFLSGWQMYLYPPEVATLIWIPAILLFYDRFLDRGKLIDAALGAFCVGQLLIGGYPVFIAHFFYVFVVYFLWRRFHRAFERNISTRRWISGLLIIAVGGVLMSSVQNYPTWEYSKLTWRSLATEKCGFRTPSEILSDKKTELGNEKTGGGLVGLAIDQLKKRMRVITPVLQSDLNESRTFTGPVVILLVLIGLFCADKKFLIIKILIIFFALFFFIPPLFMPFAMIVPGWAISALLPREVFFFLMFFMAALGLDASAEMSKNRRIVFFAVISVWAIVFFTWDWFYLRSPQGFSLSRWNAFGDHTVLLTYIYVISALLIYYGIFYSIKSSRKSRFIAIGFFVLAGLVAHFYLYPYFADPNPMPFNDELREIKAICGDERIVRFDPSEQRISFKDRLDYVLPPNIPAKFGFYDALGYDNMLLSNITAYWDKVEPGCLISRRAVPHLMDITSLRSGNWLTDGSCARFLIVAGDVNPNLFGISPGKLIHKGNLKLYRLGYTPSPIRILSAYTIVDDWSKVSSLDSLPKHVLLEKTPVMPDGRTLDSTPDSGKVPAYTPDFVELDSIKREPGNVEIRVNAPMDSLLYVADTWHPRWRAKVDNQEVEILKANLAFRAIAVPAGEHTIRMWYDGVEVLVGGIVSAIALVIVFLIGFIDLAVSNKKSSSH